MIYIAMKIPHRHEVSSISRQPYLPIIPFHNVVSIKVNLNLKNHLSQHTVSSFVSMNVLISATVQTRITKLMTKVPPHHTYEQNVLNALLFLI